MRKLGQISLYLTGAAYLMWFLFLVHEGPKDTAYNIQAVPIDFQIVHVIPIVVGMLRTKK